MKARPKTKTISFRLPLEMVDLLQERCDLTKQSFGEYIRHQLTESLMEHEQQAITNALVNVNASLSELDQTVAGNQVALRRLAFVLLTHDEKLAKNDAIALLQQIFESAS